MQQYNSFWEWAQRKWDKTDRETGRKTIISLQGARETAELADISWDTLSAFLQYKNYFSLTKGKSSTYSWRSSENVKTMYLNFYGICIFGSTKFPTSLNCLWYISDSEQSMSWLYSDSIFPLLPKVVWPPCQFLGFHVHQ